MRAVAGQPPQHDGAVAEHDTLELRLVGRVRGALRVVLLWRCWPIADEALHEIPSFRSAVIQLSAIATWARSSRPCATPGPPAQTQRCNSPSSLSFALGIGPASTHKLDRSLLPPNSSGTSWSSSPV